VSYNHRTHPSKLNRPPPGRCRWCLAVILRADGTVNRRKSWCSLRCVGEYLLRTDPKVYRQHIFFRDNGVCAACGVQHRYNNADWQADHILPLFMAFADSAAWDPENLQILCTDPCHKIKSADDRAKYGFVLEAERKRKRAARARAG
jgi:5-methylcytosine-specific restriction endonuclease McrA